MKIAKAVQINPKILAEINPPISSPLHYQKYYFQE